MSGRAEGRSRYRCRGDPHGPPWQYPALGKAWRMTGIAIVRTSHGQIVEEHANSDALGLLTQIGIVRAAILSPRGVLPRSVSE